MLKSCLSIFRAAALGLLAVPHFASAKSVEPYWPTLDTSDIGNALFDPGPFTDEDHDRIADTFTLPALMSCASYPDSRLRKISEDLAYMREWLVNNHVWDEGTENYYLKIAKSAPTQAKAVVVEAIRQLQKSEAQFIPTDSEDDFWDLKEDPVQTYNIMNNYETVVREFVRYTPYRPHQASPLGPLFERSPMDHRLQEMRALLINEYTHMKGVGDRCMNPQRDLIYDYETQIAQRSAPRIKAP